MSNFSLSNITISPSDDFFFQDNDGKPDGDPNGSPTTLTVSVSRLLENDTVFGSALSLDRAYSESSIAYIS